MNVFNVKTKKKRKCSLLCDAEWKMWSHDASGRGRWSLVKSIFASSRYHIFTENYVSRTTRQFLLILIVLWNAKCRNKANHTRHHHRKKSSQGQVIIFWHRQNFHLFQSQVKLWTSQNGRWRACIKTKFWKWSSRMRKEKRLAENFIIESEIWNKCDVWIFVDFSNANVLRVLKSVVEKFSYHKYSECRLRQWIAWVCHQRKHRLATKLSFIELYL